MSESTESYKVQGSRVYGKGHSFNCTNIATAKELQSILNNYETQIQILQLPKKHLKETEK